MFKILTCCVCCDQHNNVFQTDRIAPENSMIKFIKMVRNYMAHKWILKRKDSYLPSTWKRFIIGRRLCLQLLICNIRDWRRCATIWLRTNWLICLICGWRRRFIRRCRWILCWIWMLLQKTIIKWSI